MNNTYRNLFVIILFASLAFLVGSLPVYAAPQPQYTPFPSPTPGPDGRIIYIVQEGDTLWRVSAITGVPVDEIRKLNNLGENDIIQPGQELLLGLGGPSVQQSTPGIRISPTPPKPTQTRETGLGTLCIILYNDENGDAMRQEDEPSIPGGAISIANRDGSVSITEDTISGSDHQCFEELTEGDYNVTVAIPEGYNATTILNYPIVL
ncbi:MAG: LysM peptidoglycan-binding domain-containing protein, partial [Anaerolineales bacterium]|nr:LysM peptidoglycan-binding domain-containing protein [Anaerolineales bacterium]